LRHLLLIGEYELGVDEKHRISLPADIRKAINPDRDGTAFYLVLGRNGQPWLYPELAYEKMVFQQQPEITPEVEQLDFDHMNFALAEKLTWDSQGRMLLGEKTLRRTGLGKEITMIGSRDHLELWNRAEWQVRRDALLARRTEVAVLAKKSRQVTAGQVPANVAEPANDQG